MQRTEAGRHCIDARTVPGHSNSFEQFGCIQKRLISTQNTNFRPEFYSFTRKITKTDNKIQLRKKLNVNDNFMSCPQLSFEFNWSVPHHSFPRWGTADAKIEVNSAENPEQLIISSFMVEQIKIVPLPYSFICIFPLLFKCKPAVGSCGRRN